MRSATGRTRTLERPAALRTMPRVVAARASQADTVRRAQAAGIVSAPPPAGRLVDHVLTLARGHFMDAADAGSWTNAQRADLATSVAVLTGQPAPPPGSPSTNATDRS
jgi:hypothetical protein